MTFFRDKYKYILYVYFVLSTLFFSAGVYGQTRIKAYEAYIKKYSDIAVEHMQKYRIPASITLAQGLLESGAGMSDLARYSNNHFGIKCHRNWRGPAVYAPDDGPNDCFRKYKTVEDSYRDHAEFLAYGSRYKVLFDLSITDYKGWARGLQTTGYATDKAYANKLIKLIEDYELYRFDDKNYRKKYKEGSKSLAHEGWKHQPYKTHGLVYVIAVEGDTYASIAEEFGFKENMTDQILTWCSDAGIPVVGKIPFDPQIVEAMLQCKSIVEWAPETQAAKEIHAIYQQVVNNGTIRKSAKD
jgi:hypothetical protein